MFNPLTKHPIKICHFLLQLIHKFYSNLSFVRPYAHSKLRVAKKKKKTQININPKCKNIQFIIGWYKKCWISHKFFGKMVSNNLCGCYFSLIFRPKGRLTSMIPWRTLAYGEFRNLYRCWSARTFAYQRFQMRRGRGWCRGVRDFRGGERGVDGRERGESLGSINSSTFLK